MKRYTTIEELNSFGIPTKTPLALLIDSATFFETIYAPIKTRDEDGVETTEWVNVGINRADIANYYELMYGGKIVSKKMDVDTLKTTYSEGTFDRLKYLIGSWIAANKYKYLKLIETLGYEYNPLFNVDGVELFSTFDSHGGETRENTIKGTIKNSTNTDMSTTFTNDGTNTPTIENYTTQYNGSDAASKLASKQVQKGKTTTDVDGNASNNYSEVSYSNDYSDKVVTTHQNALNGTSEYSVAANDNAFGVAATGADSVHIEKRVRQGNIGVTKSQELIESERNLVRVNIIKEFINDLDKVLTLEVFC